ncbi:Metallo-dependent phosphatase [Russula vinacea]|nr:Metallo-dependent phosphatase [Russula vinacea]
MARMFQFLVYAGLALRSSALTYGPSSYAPPGAFPTSLYNSYYNNPTATSAQPQPVVSDPVLHKIYPAGLTNPNDIPRCNDTQDPHVLPPRASDDFLLQTAISQVKWLFANPATANNSCTLCTGTLQVGKFLALAAPEQGPAFALFLCQQFRLSNTCNNTYSSTTYGPVITQVLAYANVSGYDGQLLCQNFFPGSCSLPPTPPLNLDGGQRVKVLHLSDFHIDPRYATGAEANCTSGMCCRANTFNPISPNKSLVPAPRYGWFQCDTPFSLAASVLEAIPVLAGTENTGFAWTIYTGDLVSHDPENQLSRDYVMYTEAVLYDLFKRTLGSGPVYTALGNHDSRIEDIFIRNYDHVAGLWNVEQWIPQSAVAQARAHYAAYSVQRTDGLRVITLNTDLYIVTMLIVHSANLFNYINLSHPDTSGMLRFLTDELQDAEDNGDRVWIMGHVLSGWDGSDALEAPSNLLTRLYLAYSLPDIFYANNATNISAQTALTVSWIAPSITPLTNLNSGFRVYEVDSATFDILDAHTYEYSTREAYGTNIPWGANDPLNATWWHHVTEQMETNPSLVSSTFTNFQGKQSVHTTPCNTTQCIKAKICYMRSGSSSLAVQNCQSGF